ncbi:MAG: 23S rRNA (pseudouridine(1915)-N(3))-methyltransferase RlmH [Acidobacteriota bacterium]
MARELLIVWAGRHQRPSWERLCEDYRARIQRYSPLKDHWIKVRVKADAVRRKAEGEAMLAALPDPCWTIALDPRAKPTSSEQLARDLRRLADEWPHPIAFLIGSDLGLAEDVVRTARRRLSFGPMILGHELARLVLYEQIYRAISIDRGIKYHRSAF